MKSSAKLFFFFPFLKPLLKLGMQTVSSLYFGLIGLLLGLAAGVYLQAADPQAVYSWKMCAASGGLGGALLGVFFAPAFFKSSASSDSDFLVWAKSVSASATLSGFALPAAGFMAGFFKLVRLQKSIPTSFGEGIHQGIQNFRQINSVQGWLLTGCVFLSGIFFRKLVDALDGPDPQKPV